MLRAYNKNDLLNVLERWVYMYIKEEKAVHYFNNVHESVFINIALKIERCLLRLH